MVAIQGIAHFSIPVSDVAKSTRFYTEVVGCRHLETVRHGEMAFLDAAGTCLILVKREPPINPVLDDHGGVHHSFIVAHDDYRIGDVAATMAAANQRTLVVVKIETAKGVANADAILAVPGIDVGFVGHPHRTEQDRVGLACQLQRRLV